MRANPAEFSIPKEISFVFFDLIRIYCNANVLMQRLILAAQTEVRNNYHQQIPLDLRKSLWLNALILYVPAIVLACVVKGINMYKRYHSGVGETFKEKYATGNYVGAESYLFALLSGSQGVLLWTLLHSAAEHEDQELPFWAFCSTSAFGVIALGLMFAKLVFPDTDHRINWGKFNYLSQPAYPSVSYFERFLNTAVGAAAGVGALATAFWEVNREIEERDMPLNVTGKIFLGVAAVFSGGVGAVLTDFPRGFHAFYIAAKFVYGGATAAAALSNLASHFQAEIEASSNLNIVLHMLWAVFTAVMAVFNASIVHFQFQENHYANLWIERHVKCKKYAAGSLDVEENGLNDDDQCAVLTRLSRYPHVDETTRLMVEP